MISRKARGLPHEYSPLIWNAVRRQSRQISGYLIRDLDKRHKMREGDGQGDNNHRR